MGLGRIPWRECLIWAEHEGLDEEETESLIDLVERLDVEEIVLEQAKAAKQSKNGKQSDGADGET